MISPEYMRYSWDSEMQETWEAANATENQVAKLHSEYAAFLATNIAIIRKTPEIKVSDTDKKRIALLKEIKTGKITYDELPVPIFETEEERLNRENALAGLSKKDKKSRGEDESI